MLARDSPAPNDRFAANYELSAVPHSLQSVISYPASHPPAGEAGGRRRSKRLMAKDDNGRHKIGVRFSCRELHLGIFVHRNSRQNEDILIVKLEES